MSLFGASSKPAGGLFGGGNQQTSSPFGQNPTQQQQQPQQSLFGGFGQNQNAQNNPPPSNSLFGSAQPLQPQQQSTGLFGSFGQNQQQNQTQQPSTLFGQQSQQQQQSGNLLSSLLGQSQQQQPQQLPTLGQLGPMGQSTSLQQSGAREKSIPEQMKTILDQWDTGSPNCVFKYYFYNKIDEARAPFYRVPDNEDPKAWEEALEKKPGSGYIPVLCTGFKQMGDRITLQQVNLASFNARLHEINDALSNMMTRHETSTSVQAMEARRRHIVLKQRCLALAAKVQVLRNRGYALSSDEEVLKSKFMSLEKQISDPGMSARGEEIWARMIAVQDRARMLKSEVEKAGVTASGMLDEELARRAEQIVEDYNTQLGHLKTELKSIAEDYTEWAKDQGLPKSKATEAPISTTTYDTQRFA